MLMVVEERDKDHRYQKISDQDNGRVQIGVASQEHHDCRDNEQDYTDPQHMQPAPPSTPHVLGWLHPNILRHCHSPFTLGFSSSHGWLML